MKRILIIIVSIVITTSGIMYGQNDQFTELAEATLKNFSCSVTAQNFKYYGLSSSDALENLQAGEAIIHYAVGLTSIQTYNEDMDPNEIIEEMGYVTVPLLDKKNNSIETFVLLSRIEDNYQSIGIGEAPYSLNFIALKKRTELGKEAKLIRIPALNLAYLGVMINDTLNLVPIIDRDQKNIETQPASQVFVELAKQISKDYGDVPH